jgi:hypothetical protein
MKDLILITAYCPDDYRENKLRNLVNSLNLHSQLFDLMVVSHTPIPLDIQKKVDLIIYDKKNEILTDWDMLNQPWFNPGNDRRIQSSYLSKINTHLAIWRMMILGFSTAKNLGYNKLHHIEYDSEINNINEFIENSNHLSNYTSVIYVDKQPTVDPILLGSFQSYQLNSLPSKLINLDEEWIKNFIRTSPSKSPELMLQRLLEEKGRVLYKDRNDLERGGNKFGIVDGQMENNFIPWAIPFYDRLTNELGFVVWNTQNEDGVKHQIIINDNQMYDIPFTPHNNWRIEFIGNFDSIENLLIIENNKIRENISLKTKEEKDIFKRMSFRHKTSGEGDND